MDQLCGIPAADQCFRFCYIDRTSDFIWGFGKLPFPEHLGKYFIKIGKIKAIFGLEIIRMTPI